MKYRRWLPGSIAGLILGGLLTAVGGARGDDSQPPKANASETIVEPLKAVVTFQKSDDAQPAVQVEVAHVGDYWIGVMCRPVEPELAEHLDIDHGLIVEQVVDGSPADKAGLKKNDILLRVADTDVKETQNLIDAVEKQKDQPLTLTVMRKGQQKTLKITAEKRPDEARTAIVEKIEQGGEGKEPAELREFKQRFERIPGAVFDKDGLRMYFVRPGFVLPEAVKLPDNVEITITKKGNEVAKIVVKRDDKSWEVNEKKLDELPADIQPLVKQFLGGHGTYTLGFSDLPKISKQLTIPKLPAVPQLDFRWSPEARAKMEQQLQELREHMEKLGKDASKEDAIAGLKKELKSLRREIEELRAAAKDKAKDKDDKESDK